MTKFTLYRFFSLTLTDLKKNALGKPMKKPEIGLKLIMYI